MMSAARDCWGLVRRWRGVAAALVVAALAGCEHVPKDLEQPIPATREEALASLEQLMNVACVSVVYVGFENGWLVWRTQIHDPVLRWETYRLLVDDSLAVVVERSSKLGWDVMVTSGGGGADGGGADGGELSGGIAARAKPVKRAVFTTSKSSDAGRVKAALLGLVR